VIVGGHTWWTMCVPSMERYLVVRSFAPYYFLFGGVPGDPDLMQSHVHAVGGSMPNHISLAWLLRCNVPKLAKILFL